MFHSLNSETCLCPDSVNPLRAVHFEFPNDDLSLFLVSPKLFQELFSGLPQFSSSDVDLFIGHYRYLVPLIQQGVDRVARPSILSLFNFQLIQFYFSGR